MGSIKISSRAKLFSGDPRKAIEVTDAEVLRTFHGMHSDDQLCSLEMERDLVDELEINGGRIHFHFDETQNCLRVTTVYGAERELSAEATQRLVQETKTQWAEGIGNGLFEFVHEQLIGAGFYQTIVDEGIDLELPDYCVQTASDDQPTPEVTWSESGNPNDLLLDDLKQAAEAGDVSAKTELGSLLVDGEMATGRNAEGIALLESAADENNEFATMKLGSAYLKGEGETPVDVEKGVAYYQRAIDEGSTFAISALGEAYKEGKGVEQDTDKALKLLNEAVSKGDPVGMAELGDCYEFGVGVDVDLKKASELYKQALEMGFDPVEPAYERVQQQMKQSGGFFKWLLGLFMPRSKKALEVPEENFVFREGDDEKLAAAVAQAQATLSQFAKRLPKLKQFESAALKVAFKKNGVTEHMWITDVEFKDGHFHGILANDPELITSMECGDSQRVHPNDVDDWMITDADGNYEGGFSVAVFAGRS
ncbi:MAG: DUF2314 domain-containing protein [Planctomycetota bacterium]